MDDAFGNALVIEVEYLLAQHEILEQRGTARTRLQAVLIIADGYAKIGSKLIATRLMKFPSVAKCLAWPRITARFIHSVLQEIVAMRRKRKLEKRAMVKSGSMRISTSSQDSCPKA